MLSIIFRIPLLSSIVKKIVTWGLLLAFLWIVYYVYWGSHLYRITAYCNCPICINVPEFRTGRFASQKHIYWGGVAGDKSVSFGSRIELVPLFPKDWHAIAQYLRGRRRFTVEDRGGMIKGKDIDIFIPDSRGGHQAARKWGVHYMRIKINGKFAP